MSLRLSRRVRIRPSNQLFDCPPLIPRRLLVQSFLRLVEVIDQLDGSQVINLG